MRALKNHIRGYAWGSHDILAQLEGRPVPSPGPEAELWVGAHPDNPSTVVDAGTGLDAVIAAAPSALLGEEAVDRFGPRLSFLMKVLAAERPLSVQTHPDAWQAAAGYMAEDAAGIPRTSPERSYVDPHHKPELVVALTPFEALAGFREFADLTGVLAALGIQAKDLREAVREILMVPSARRKELVAAAVALDPLSARLAEFYPDDLGVVLALLLNHVVVEPGEAIWMPAGSPHAYIRGAAVEIMAASDNVLRGGLTPKHVNVPELLRVLRFDQPGAPVARPVPVADGVVTWPVPVPDFRLHRVRVDGTNAELSLVGPRLVLAYSGSVTVTDRAGSVSLTGGQAAFSAADGGPLEFSGAGEVYVGSL